MTEFRIEVAAFRETRQLEADGVHAAYVRREQVSDVDGPIRRYIERDEGNLKQHWVRYRREVQAGVDLGLEAAR